MEIVFLQAHKSLNKVYSSQGAETYPLVKNFTSYHPDIGSLQSYADAIREHASKGHCLYKGLLKQRLENESRKDKTDTLADTRTLILDVDGLTVDVPGLKGRFTAEKLRAVAESVVSQIPKLANVSYVACASSSCGLVDSVRMHLHFFLDGYVAPKALKEWLKSVNLDFFNDKLRMTPHGKTVKWVIDPCLAENSRIVYIAPPEFKDGIENPFSSADERVIYVQKSTELAPLSADIKAVDPEVVSQKTDEVLKRLCKEKGIKLERATYTTLGNVPVINNPNRMSMRYAYHNDKFCYYNVGPTGDSNAYYVFLDNPTVVHNFKGEDPFLFQVADPDTYKEHLERFKDRKPTDGSKFSAQPLVFLEQGNSFLLALYSPKERAIVVEESTNDKSKAELWFNHYGRALPEQIPLGERRFDPTSNEVFVIDEASQYTYVNSFRPTEYMRKQYQAPIPEVGYNNAWMLQFLCPTIYKIIAHMLAYDDQTICHFLNWFAYIFQNRKKPETCWVLQGTQGTGKGAFYRNVCRPLWGENYAFEKQLQNFEDDKNGWERYALLVLIDEVNMKTLKDGKKTEATLKNLITDDERTIRAMRQEQVQMKSYMSVIMSTNDLNALNIPDNDRRYNVAPRQEARLRDAFPEFVYDREHVDALLASETDNLAAFLSTFKVNVPQAFIALENKAKNDAREAGKTSSEAFFSAVRSGDLDYFTGVLEAKEVDQTLIVVAAKCRTIVTNWLVSCNEHRQVFVENEELRLLYHLIEGTKELTSNKFGRLAKSYGIGAERSNNKRGVHVNWKMDMQLLKSIISDLAPEDKQRFDTANKVVQMTAVGGK